MRGSDEWDNFVGQVPVIVSRTFSEYQERFDKALTNYQDSARVAEAALVELAVAKLERAYKDSEVTEHSFTSWAKGHLLASLLEWEDIDYIVNHARKISRSEQEFAIRLESELVRRRLGREGELKVEFSATTSPRFSL